MGHRVLESWSEGREREWLLGGTASGEDGPASVFRGKSNHSKAEADLKLRRCQQSVAGIGDRSATASPATVFL